MKKIGKKVTNAYIVRNIYFLSLYFFILSLIINRTPYGAELQYVMIPAVLCVFFALLCKPKIKIRDNISISIMLISLVISTVVSDVVELTFSSVGFGFIVFSYMIITSVDYSEKDVSLLIKIYSNIALLYSLYLITVYFVNIGTKINYRAALYVFGEYKDQNYTAAFLAPAFTFLFCKVINNKKGRIKYLFSSILVFWAIYVTGSRASFLAIMLIIILGIVMIAPKSISKNKYIILIALLCLVFYGTYMGLSKTELFSRMSDVSGYTDNIRLKIWKGAINGFYEHPFIGGGLYSGSYYSLMYTKWVTHNCFLDILIGQGLIGVFCYIFIFAKVLLIKKESRGYMLLVLISFFVPLFFVNGYETYTFWFAMIFCKIISDVGNKELLANIYAK